ncbi:MAG: hypothetical protein CUN52_06205 [Phototrophicales bacterium]|nr:MAG: hypothetical protein CUN52_06205 [Phototrophicales bacterium]
MPTLTRYHIKMGLMYFLLSLFMGVILVAQPIFNLSIDVWTLRPVFFHFLVVGWITQIIIGVAHWMFPKRSKEQPRGNLVLGWMVFICLNIGLVFRGFAEPLFFIYPESIWGWTLVLSAVLQVVAGWLFVFNIWGRVKER